MRLKAAVIERVRLRWQYYVMMGRWKRAHRLNAVLKRLETPVQGELQRLSA